MKKIFALAALLCLTLGLHAQGLEFKEAKFSYGDNAAWKELNANDAGWQTIKANKPWKDENGDDVEYVYGWYRIKFNLPKSMLEKSYQKDILAIEIGKVDDCCEVYLNGTKLGGTGVFPTGGDKESYKTAWFEFCKFALDTQSPAIKWGQDNILAIRVYNGHRGGGINTNGIKIYIEDLIEHLKLTTSSRFDDKKQYIDVALANDAGSTQEGTLKMEKKDPLTGKTQVLLNKKVKVPANQSTTVTANYPNVPERVTVTTTYTDSHTGKKKVLSEVPQYILTPKAAPAPRINGGLAFGVRPGSPVLYKIAASGQKPMRYEVEGLPAGLKLDAAKGIITGKLEKEGDYKMKLKVSNAAGTDVRDFTIKVGEALALTPPMGWNSWNVWGLHVSEQRVLETMQAFIDKGLIDYGFTYINIDDAWQPKERNADGTITPNEKFPNMKALADKLHAEGMKLGIYSSPGRLTCGEYLGSLHHEAQDAKSYADWGIDYLKYDWCFYKEVFEEDRDFSTYAHMKPYKLMEKELRKQNRDIIYSLCQYGNADVWQWGRIVDANSWRTTGDINDSWNSLYNIGFQKQRKLYPYAGPGHWNDPDMLIVGIVGWGADMRPTRLTVDEQYTHITLWCLLDSPLLVGCDMANLDDFTVSLLSNSEVLEVNQDLLGRQAKPVLTDGDIEVWAKEMSDGSQALGIFNLGDKDKKIDVASVLKKAEINASNQMVRDLWRQQDRGLETLTSYLLPTHGTLMLRVK